MAKKTKTHELEYIEQGFLEANHRVKCACGVEQEVDTVREGMEWHAAHVETEAEKAKKRACAKTA